MPPKNPSVETRLTEVEEELRRIRQLLDDQGLANGVPWWKKMIGSHENDPVFAEIVKLGRKIRRGERTSSRRAKKGTT